MGAWEKRKETGIKGRHERWQYERVAWLPSLLLLIGLRVLIFPHFKAVHRLLSWLKQWHHPSKKSTTGDVVHEGSLHSQHKPDYSNQRVRHSLTKYGRREWIPHWNLLHLDRRSCAQTKDVRTEGPHRRTNDNGGSQPALPKEGKTDIFATQRKVQSTSLADLHERVNESSSLKVTGAGTEFCKRGASMDVGIVGVDLHQHKSGLKNRVLPMTAQEDAHFSTAFKLRTTTLFSVDEEGPGPGPVLGVATKTAPENPKRIGPLSFKRINFASVSSTPVSPRSPSENKWRMLLSCSSQAGSPRSSRCFHGQAEWSSPSAEMSHQKGSFSTMGSPWHSQAGGIINHRASSFKGSYKQGQWITTNSDFVVLEL